VDDAQSFDISLDSPLEVIANQGIVDARSPSFSHNTQQQIGDMMANAIKYEGDGLFTDWYHHKVDLIAEHLIESDFYDVSKSMGFFSGGAARRDFLRFLDKATGLNFSASLVDVATAEIGSLVVAERTTDTDYTLVGATSEGQPWTVHVDPYTLNIITSSLPTDFQASISPGSGTNSFQLYVRPLETGQADIVLPLHEKDSTAYVWGKDGLINYVKSPGGDRYAPYDVNKYIDVNPSGSNAIAAPPSLLTILSTTRSSPDVEEERDRVEVVSDAENILKGSLDVGPFVTGIKAYGGAMRLDQLAPTAVKTEDSLAVDYGMVPGYDKKGPASRYDWDYIDYIAIKRVLSAKYMLDMQLLTAIKAMGRLPDIAVVDRITELTWDDGTRSGLNTYSIDNGATYRTVAFGDTVLVKEIVGGGPHRYRAIVIDGQYDDVTTTQPLPITWTIEFDYQPDDSWKKYLVSNLGYIWQVKGNIPAKWDASVTELPTPSFALIDKLFLLVIDSTLWFVQRSVAPIVSGIVATVAALPVADYTNVTTFMGVDEPTNLIYECLNNTPGLAGQVNTIADLPIAELANVGQAFGIKSTGRIETSTEDTPGLDGKVDTFADLPTTTVANEGQRYGVLDEGHYFSCIESTPGLDGRVDTQADLPAADSALDGQQYGVLDVGRVFECAESSVAGVWEWSDIASMDYVWVESGDLTYAWYDTGAMTYIWQSTGDPLYAYMWTANDIPVYYYTWEEVGSFAITWEDLGVVYDLPTSFFIPGVTTLNPEEDPLNTKPWTGYEMYGFYSTTADKKLFEMTQQIVERLDAQTFGWREAVAYIPGMTHYGYFYASWKLQFKDLVGTGISDSATGEEFTNTRSLFDPTLVFGPAIITPELRWELLGTPTTIASVIASNVTPPQPITQSLAQTYSAGVPGFKTLAITHSIRPDLATVNLDQLVTAPLVTVVQTQVLKGYAIDGTTQVTSSFRKLRIAQSVAAEIETVANEYAAQQAGPYPNPDDYLYPYLFDYYVIIWQRRWNNAYSDVKNNLVGWGVLPMGYYPVGTYRPYQDTQIGLIVELKGVATRSYFGVHISNFHLDDYEIVPVLPVADPYQPEAIIYSDARFFDAGLILSKRMWHVNSEHLTQLGALLDRDSLSSYDTGNKPFTGANFEIVLLTDFTEEKFGVVLAPKYPNGRLTSSQGMLSGLPVMDVTPFDPDYMTRNARISQHIEITLGDATKSATVAMDFRLSEWNSMFRIAQPDITYISSTSNGLVIPLADFLFVGGTAAQADYAFTLRFKDSTSYVLVFRRSFILSRPPDLLSDLQIVSGVMLNNVLQLMCDYKSSPVLLTITELDSLVTLDSSAVALERFLIENHVATIFCTGADIARVSVTFKGFVTKAVSGLIWVSQTVAAGYTDIRFEYEGEPHYVRIYFEGRELLQITSKDIRTGEEYASRISDAFDQWFIEGHKELAKHKFKQQYAVDNDHILGWRNNDFLWLMLRIPRADVEGDFWEKIAELDLESSLQFSSSQYLGVSCAIGQLPYIFNITELDASTTGINGFRIRYAELSTTSLVLNWKESVISTVLAQPNTTLPTNAIPLLRSSEDRRLALSSLTISSARSGGELLIGLFQSRLVQYTLVITASSATTRVITAYGSVGPSGLVTGNAIPSSYTGRDGLTKIESFDAGWVFKEANTFLTIGIDFANGQNLISIPLSTNQTRKLNEPQGLASELGLGQFMQVTTKVGTMQMSGIIPRPYMETDFIGGATANANAFWSGYGWHVDRLINKQIGMLAAAEKHSIGASDNMLYNLARGLTKAAVGSVNNAYDAIAKTGQQSGAAAIADAKKNFAAVGDVVSDEIMLARVAACEYASPWYVISDEAAVWAGPGFTQVQAAYVAEMCGETEFKYKFDTFGVRILSPMPEMNIPITIPMAGSFTIPLSSALGAELEGVEGDSSGGQQTKSAVQSLDRIIGKHVVFSYPMDTEQAQTLIEPRHLLKAVEQPFSVDVGGGIGAGGASTGKVKTFGPDFSNVERAVTGRFGLIQGTARIEADTNLPIAFEKPGKSIEDSLSSVFSELMTQAGFFVGEAALMEEGAAAAAGRTNAQNYRTTGVRHGDILNGLQFADPGLLDYCVLPQVELYYTAVGNDVVGLSVRDTKILDGLPNNIVVNGDTVTMGAPYISLKYAKYEGKVVVKPIQADALYINTTGVNVLKGLRLHHGFDGVFFRILSASGITASADTELQYSIHHVNDDATDFKTSNQSPPTSYFANKLQYPTFGKLYHSASKLYSKAFSNINAAPVNLYGYRYSIPIVHDTVDFLPHTIKTYATYPTHIIEGVTSLTTEIRTTSTLLAAVVPVYKDFTIYGKSFRVGKEFISRIMTQTGVTWLNQVAPCLGLEFVGSTTRTAWFFSESLRHFFIFTSTEGAQAADLAVELKDAGLAALIDKVIDSKWDFTAQESALRAVLEGHHTIIRLGDDFKGQIYWPNETIALNPEEFRTYSASGGLVIAGRRRFQVSRFLMQPLMLDPVLNLYDIGRNRKRWIPVKGDDASQFWSERDYKWCYTEKDDTPLEAVEGYFVEPFKLATSFLGVGDDQDGVFEWEITFGINDMFRKLWQDRYIKVNVAADTITPGGQKRSEVSHIYLKQDLFTRGARLGYYTTRFSSLNGAGAGEKLYIWSDGLIGIRAIKLGVKNITQRRASVSVNRPDISGMEEY
jgi:hypothetical protein